jgi:hypothetical protein
VAAWHIEDLVARGEPEDLPEQLGLTIGEVVVEPGLVEVEVVLAEHVRRHVIHGTSSQLDSDG